MSGLYLFIAFVLFVGLVVVHEWGHYIAARRGGVDVEEFGIGFPPKIWGKQVSTKNGSKFLFSINLLPLGGFVRLKGENDADKRPGSFGASNLSTKVKVMLAGVTMNLIVSFGLFTILALIGMPKLVDNQFTVQSDTKLAQEIKNPGLVLIDSVGDNTPASKIGLEKGDRIVSIAGEKVTNVSGVGETTRQNSGKTIPITIERSDQTFTYSVTLNAENNGEGYLGVTSRSGEEGREVRRSTWSAPIVAGGITVQFTQLTLKGLGTAIGSLVQGDTEKAKEQVAGPVGIAYILNEVSKVGFNFVLMVIAIISLTLAIINALPIPALDGGRLFVLLLFRALKKPLTKEREEIIHGSGFLALMGLFVLITIVDVNRFIR